MSHLRRDAARGAVAGFLTVQTRAFYQAMGFVLAHDLPGLWDADTAVLLVRPLGADP